MKEIKFRNVKRYDTEYKLEYTSVDELEGEDSWQGKVNYTLENRDLYTGLKDKNGKEIYEGDICLHDEESVFSVVFENGAFRKHYPSWLEGSSKVPLDKEQIEDLKIHVIGNIYENPELLNCE